MDLVGLPRVDLSVHAPVRDVDIGFVTRLDPALKPATDPAEPAILVLHFVRHQEPAGRRGLARTAGQIRPSACWISTKPAWKTRRSTSGIRAQGPGA